MATRFLVKKHSTAKNVSRAFSGDFSGYILRQATARIGGSYSLSTAYDRAQGMRDQRMPKDDYDDRSTSSYVEDKAKEGVKKATEAAVNAGDTMKETMDGAWKAAKETGQNISDAVTGDDDGDYHRTQVDDATAAEYRAVEELRTKAGGYDKSD